MSDLSQTRAPGGRTLPGGSVDRLATRALSCVARRQQTSGPAVIAARQAQLLEAVVSSDPAAVQAAVRDMMRAGIAPDVIADRYVPEVARRLGEMWCSDETGFAVVTIGAARLQGLLRVLEGMAGPQRRAVGGGASLLVIVPEGIHHTLGAMVLTGQMRRCGHAVHLLLGAGAGVVSATVAQGQFDVVMISAPRGTRAEAVRRIVRAVRTAGARLPVVIGGTLLDQAVQEGADIRQMTGADHATSDPGEALRLCGLTSDAFGDVDPGQGH